MSTQQLRLPGSFYELIVLSFISFASADEEYHSVLFEKVYDCGGIHLG